MNREFEVIPDWKLTPEIAQWMIEVYDNAIEANPQVWEQLEQWKYYFIKASTEFKRTEIEEYCLEIATGLYDDDAIIWRVVRPVK